MLGIDFLKQYLGLHEVKDELKIRAILQRYSIRRDIDVFPSATPWCSSMINACERAVGNPGTGRLNARSFLKYGQQVLQKDVQYGDICVFERGHSTWAGHVAYLDHITPEGLLACVGGNQSNTICLSWFPKKRLLGIRRFIRT